MSDARRKRIDRMESELAAEPTNAVIDGQRIEVLEEKIRGLEAAASDRDREIDNLEIALTRRTVIGMGLGILMEQLSLDYDGAFDHLKRVSQNSNRKLYDVAASIVETRILP